jgi:hypothetical protein
MKSHGKSVIAALLFGTTLAIAGCGSDSTSSNSGVFGPGTTTTIVGTGTGTGPSGQPMLVRLGTDNLVQSDPPLYRKLWVAIVTDIVGNPVASATVIFTLRSGRFLKGRYVLPPAPPFIPQAWLQSPTVLCPNEDLNNNGILDPGEDINGNGLLDSLGHSTVNTTGISDASGVARGTIVYPKDAATWSELTLVASSGVGTPATATFFLDGLATDYSDLAIAPPGSISPFGAGGSCADTL